MKRLDFIHIPKTGGTTIEDVGHKHHIKWGRNNRDSNTTVHHKCSTWHNPSRSFDHTTFCVIRDPLDRMVSEYKDQLKLEKHHSQKDWCNSSHLNDWVVHTLTNNRQNPDHHDCHLLTQSDFTESCDVKLDFNRLDKDFNNLMSKAYKDKNITIGDVPKKNVGSAKCNVSVDDFTDNVRNLILEEYAADVDLYEQIKTRSVVTDDYLEL
tara:strand:+ start:213 stop:839 length:627 start_codon:yes stop_codon:yes gene_type:complete